MIKVEEIKPFPKKGRPRIEERSQTIEAMKPWVALQMSRRTWYKRQAEKRKDNEK